jgi:hypothetical protein
MGERRHHEIIIRATHILFLAPAVYWASEVAKEHEHTAA